MPTLADFQEIDPATGQPVAQKTAPAASNQPVDLRGIAPDMTTQDPDMFAALTAHRAKQTAEMPTGDFLNDVYSKALAEANLYHRNQAEQQERANVELQSRKAAVTSGLLSAEKTTEEQAKNVGTQQQTLWSITPLGVTYPDTYGKNPKLAGETPLTLKAKEESGVDVIKQNQLKQDAEGPEAKAEAIRRGLYGTTVLYAPTEKMTTQLEGIENGYSKLNDLQDLHTQATNAAAFGGVLKSTIGGLLTQPGITSQAVRNFNTLQHASITPLAIGLLGDTARAATMPGQQENMLGHLLPNQDDNLPGAGNKIFIMKKMMIDQLQSIYDNNQNKYAMDRVTGLLAKLHSDFDSDAVQQYNPYSTKNQPVVGYGNTQEGKDQVATAATSGIQRLNVNQGGPTPPSALQQLGQQPGQQLVQDPFGLGNINP